MSRDAGDSGSHSRILSPRTWSLRMRLLLTQVVLLAAVCASIGLATEFALQRFLVRQLDNQVVEAGKRSAAIFELPPPMFRPPPTGRRTRAGSVTPFRPAIASSTRRQAQAPVF